MRLLSEFVKLKKDVLDGHEKERETYSEQNMYSEDALREIDSHIVTRLKLDDEDCPIPLTKQMQWSFLTKELLLKTWKRSSKTFLPNRVFGQVMRCFNRRKTRRSAFPASQCTKKCIRPSSCHRHDLYPSSECIIVG